MHKVQLMEILKNLRSSDNFEMLVYTKSTPSQM